MAHFNADDPEFPKRLRAMFGPGQVDHLVRQGLQMGWMMLPDDGRTADEVERQFRRIVDRAIKDFRDDAEAFGGPTGPTG